MSILSKIFGGADSRLLSNLTATAEKINSIEGNFSSLSPEELKNKTKEFKSRLEEGETLDDILPEAFAAVREAAKRTLGQRHYDVQLIGGMVLHKGQIAEMRTGEGKTLVATLAVYLNALTGKGVHVVTVNDYLARRDTAWMGQVYDTLGLTVGCINPDASYIYDATHKSGDHTDTISTDEADKARDTLGSFKIVHEFLRPAQRKEAYAADITYGTNSEFGFDYLRDNMVYKAEQMVQRGHSFAIIDEVDSILIDEARTPLIISAPDEDSGKLYQTFAKIVPILKETEDYTLSDKRDSVLITEAGIEKVQNALGMGDIYNEGGITLVHHLEEALKAQVLFKRDKQYVVKDDQVIIVDESTGRLMPGRRWSEGLHQAIEAKEGVKIQKESKTLATITVQNYFRQYEKLSGMTGTARTSSEEFNTVYGIDVTSIPTHKPIARQDLPDRVYKTELGKFKAVAREVKERHQKGQPILIGTGSIEKNEELSALLKAEGIPHNVLNAKHHEKEGEMHAQAGRRGSVTVATNMAGRGVDIILGGNPPIKEEADLVKELGGLHVIGTERHEARRIDDQLRGRAGRQGDIGSSQFFVSTEDELVQIFSGDRLKNVMERLGVGDEDVIENSLVSKAIQQAQAKVEGHRFDQRKSILEYDDVMNKHRTAVYNLRRNAIQVDSIKDKILESIDEVMGRIVSFNFSEYDMDSATLTKTLESIIGPDANLQAEIDKEKVNGLERLTLYIKEYALKAYKKRESELGEEQIRNIEKLVVLRVIDELWIQHLETMRHLQQSVQLRAFGNRDPLIEYKLEAHKLYGQLMESIKNEITSLIFRVSVVSAPKQTQMKAGFDNGPVSEEKPTPIVSDGPQLGRNDPCFCGSGLKYKKCGLLNTEEHQRLANKK